MNCLMGQGLKNYDRVSMRNGQESRLWPPLLQSWYRLSDPGLAKQLVVDLLFRQFIGLEISESAPDHSRLWRFRQKLEEASLLERLLSETNEQLAGQGLYMKSGAVSIDASVIEAKSCIENRPLSKEDKQFTGYTQAREAPWSGCGVLKQPDGMVNAITPELSIKRVSCA